MKTYFTIPSFIEKLGCVEVECQFSEDSKEIRVNKYGFYSWLLRNGRMPTDQQMQYWSTVDQDTIKADLHDYIVDVMYGKIAKLVEAELPALDFE